MTARRMGPAHIAWLAERCGTRDLAILQTANRLRLVSGQQLERLHFAGLAGRSRAVTRWRVLKRLTDWGLIAPLERRVGGGARGSAGAVYVLDSAGARLLRLFQHEIQADRIRRPASPSEQNARHTLAVTGLYVSLVEHSHADGFNLARFEVEPQYQTHSGWIRPDAYAVLEAADVADHWWIEVDRATESAARVRRKIEAYTAYYEQGRWAQLGVMPRVLVAVPDERRRGQLAAAIPPGTEKIVEIAIQETAVCYMLQTLTNTHS